ncbi:ABC-2 type transport system ATP-binding protein [Streptomyces sp. 3330]|uniref:ABC transporter ATP-binding protein n=1 Tax=Streptomyces sp. 3330 TaxID=2817755 RepID=UPI0028590163|nr:ABC transporter ATP-binding protein [Streptomyces sp. 3330]MDR6981009.1 ABC-2 type transport system ATP-binding protein [Streptomyces sp. 3330]
MSAIVMRDVRRAFDVVKGSAWRMNRRVQQFEALRGVNLDVSKGELFGLLGPNGAGKTTTIKILTTLLVPTSGEVYLNGLDSVRNPDQVRSRIGYVFGGDKGLYDRLSARDNLRYFANLYRIAPGQQRRRINELLEMLSLTDRQNDRVETFSRGMKQRLHIARGLLHDPDIIYLDEPTNGLDPLAARDVRDIVRRLKHSGKTILLTTHYMFEAEDLCDRLAVIAGGRIIAEGTSKDLGALANAGPVVRAEVTGGAQALCRALEDRADVVNCHLEPLSGRELVTIRFAAQTGVEASRVVGEAAAADTGVQLLDLQLREPTLEDKYVTLVSQSLDKESA